MKRFLTVAALILSGFTAFGQEPDLVEGARRAITYWHSLFLHCGGNQDQGGAWYTVNPNGPSAGSIQMVPELRIQFKTEELSEEQRLNGFEFKATTSVDPGAFRWWILPNKAWRDWQVGEITSPRVLIKKKGVWTGPNRFEDTKAPASCSDIPGMEDRH